MRIAYLLILSLRPQQWVKNLVVFAAVIFSLNALDITMLLQSLSGFLIFCGIAGGNYVINDLIDLKPDKEHKGKAKRPLASGQLSPLAAGIFALIVISVSLYESFSIHLQFGIICILYLSLMILYSFLLKHVVILDVLAISGGFVLRAIAGAVIINVLISPWLIICALLLSLFLALAKRRYELIKLEAQAIRHRKILAEYSSELLNQLIPVVTSATVISYSLYTISETTIEKFNTEKLHFTIPFVLYGIFRYLYLTYKKEDGGTPEKLLFSDKPLLINCFLWLIVTILIIYT